MNNNKLNTLLEKARASLIETTTASAATEDGATFNTASTKSLSQSSVIRLLNQYSSEHAPNSNQDSAISFKVTKSSIKVEINQDKLANSTLKSAQHAGKRDPTLTHLSNAEKKNKRVETAGPKWFDMKAPKLTDQVKRDLQLLKMRNVLDPKRFYKRENKNQATPKYFQFGTIIEGPTEFYSSRLTKKQRKGTIVDELLADSQARSYYKKKYSEIQSKKQSGGKNFYRKVVKKRSNRK